MIVKVTKYPKKCESEVLFSKIVAASYSRDKHRK